ncbi:condensation domain-containing protein [Actinosynnema pretiosum]|uniref:Non-ribosomal peptide synthetase/polyketide synthase n=2 Tax=Actinosynnema TaxID=40566 RepID=A0A290Z7P4_9PSEU|nr:condensation domain-containing protein [Actinosynnema pretiosum]ATE55002.1 non-ribosomal peptide synthetase/polyketide synthase [Actinosynnema pretiosum]
MSSSSYVGGVGGGPARDYTGLFVLPAAPAQRQLWFLCQLEPAANAAYNIVSAAELVGDVDVVALQGALNRVVARHESLRTGIGVVDGEPCQVVVPEALVSLPVVDVSGPDAEGARARALRLAEEQAARPFTLDEPPLLRAVLVREAADRHVLVAVIHHVVCDGWSTEVFHRDLAHSYRDLLEGRADDRPELPVQYADYVAWNGGELAGGRLRELTEHWRSRLAGTPALDLPVDRPRAQGRGGGGGRVESRLDAATTADLVALAARADATPFMVLLTAFQLALAAVTGQDDITVGTPVAGRHHPDTEDVVGYFANTLVLRTRLPLADGLRACLAATRDTCLAAFSHEQMPFDHLVEQVGHAGVLDRNPLFDVMFSMQNTPGVSAALPGVRMSQVALPFTSAKFDLWLTVAPEGDGLRLHLDFDRGLYERATAARLLGLFETAARGLRQGPDGATTLPAGEAERAELARWATGPALPPCASTTPEALSRRVPDDVVVSTPDTEVTAAGLADRVREAVDLLRAEGVRGTTVTVPPGTGIDTVVAALAALEAGAVLRYGTRPDRTGALLRRDPDDPTGWRVTTGPRFDPATTSSAPDPDTAALAGSGTPSPGGTAGRAGAERSADGRGEPLRRTAAEHPAAAQGGPGRPAAAQGGLADRPVAHDGLADRPGAPSAATDLTADEGAPAHHDPDRRAAVRSALEPRAVESRAADPRAAAAHTPAARPVDHRALVRTAAAVAERLGVEGRDVAVLGATPHPVDLLVALAHGRRLVLEGGPAEFLFADAPTWRSLLTDGHPVPEGATLVCHDEVVAPDLLDALARTGNPVAVGRRSSAVPLPFALAPLAGPARLGPPLAGQERPLLGADGHPAPFGAVGELHLVGHGGTGLLCRHTSDGDLEVVALAGGRLAVGDHPVRPERVESVLAEVDGVRAAAVSTGELGGATALLGWLVPDRAARTARERDELAASARARALAALPAHEVPARFGVLPELPRLPDGAPDRAALAALRGQGLVGALDDTPPRNRLERLAMGVFHELLPTRGYGVHADFFALGGHSLLAAKVIARVRDEAGVLVPVREFFRTPTPAGLAKAVADAEQDRDRRPADRADALRGQLAGMSDEEVERLLRQLG